MTTPSARAQPVSASPYSRWPRGPSTNAAHFPIAVWLQSPANAKRYAAAGFNTYVGLWQGPTEEQLAALKSAGMKVICEQNATGRRHEDDSTIIGWMHGDEPDNAQALGSGGGYGPPVPPAEIVRDYERIQQADPSRPILLNLGQGVAWDGWHGRGTRTNHPEDYPEYVRGGDIISFDIYPVSHDQPEIAGRLWYVAQGVDRLVKWTAGRKIIWDCIECTRINHPTRKPTAAEVRSLVWMSLIHGAQGLIYFVHEWQPRFNEAALLDDPPLLAAVTAINRQVTRLAPVLNRPSTPGAITVSVTDSGAPVALMVKSDGPTTYVFAVGMRDTTAEATFRLPTGPAPGVGVEVVDENRRLTITEGSFRDHFQPWEVHLYRIPPVTRP